MATATSRTASSPAASHKNVFLALLCAAAVVASFLPLSSAGVSPPLVSQTCRRTLHEGLCISTLESDSESATAETVQQLAVIALRVARNATVDAVRRATDLLGFGAAPTSPATPQTPPLPPERDVLAQCLALYKECLRATTRTIAAAAAARYADAARAASLLREYPDRCESLLNARGIRSPLHRTNQELQGKLVASQEIVSLLLLD